MYFAMETGEYKVKALPKGRPLTIACHVKTLRQAHKKILCLNEKITF
jgi:hypothetical protein